MNVRIDDQIVLECRVSLARGFDPFGVPGPASSSRTGEPVTELMARLQQAEPAIRPASEEDSRAYSTPTARQDE